MNEYLISEDDMHVEREILAGLHFSLVMKLPSPCKPRQMKRRIHTHTDKTRGAFSFSAKETI